MGRVVSLSLVLAKHRRNTSPAVSSLLHNALRYDMNTEKCYWRHPCYWEHPQKLARLRASRTTFQTMTIKEVQYITNRPLFFPYKVLLSQILISVFFSFFKKRKSWKALTTKHIKGQHLFEGHFKNRAGPWFPSCQKHPKQHRGSGKSKVHSEHIPAPSSQLRALSPHKPLQKHLCSRSWPTPEAERCTRIAYSCLCTAHHTHVLYGRRAAAWMWTHTDFFIEVHGVAHAPTHICSAWDLMKFSTDFPISLFLAQNMQLVNQ